MKFKLFMAILEDAKAVAHNYRSAKTFEEVEDWHLNGESDCIVVLQTGKNPDDPADYTFGVIDCLRKGVNPPVVRTTYEKKVDFWKHFVFLFEDGSVWEIDTDGENKSTCIAKFKEMLATVNKKVAG